MTKAAVVKAETKVPAVYDEEAMEALAGHATPADAVARPTPDVLKINYDEDAEYPRGTWVLGQKKGKDGAITEQGVKVGQIVVLAVRYRYSAFCEGSGEYISTQVFANGQQPADLAEKKAMAVAQGCELRFQTLLYGLALLEDGMREFVSYMSGSSYTAVRDLVRDLTKHPVTGKANVLPVFSYIVRLEPCEKKKFQSNTYFVPVFKLGNMITAEQVDFFAQAREQAVEYIDYSNSQRAATEAVSPATVKPVVHYEPPKASVDVPGPKSASITVPLAEVEGEVQVTPSDDDYDIEAAVKAVLGGKKATTGKDVPF